MARSVKTVGDEGAPAEGRPGPPPPPEYDSLDLEPDPAFKLSGGRRRALPWLMFVLACTGLVTLLVRGLNQDAQWTGELAAARDDVAELRRNLFTTQHRLRAAEQRGAEQASQAEQLAEKIVAHDAEHDAQQKLIAELKQQLGAKEGDVSSEQNRITVKLVDEILFKSGEAEISSRGKELLGRVGGVLKGLSDKQILVSGHTDNRPIHNERFPSNWELSSARAVNVVRYLAEFVGVDARKLAAAGFGEFHPRSRDKAKNRRIEILLTPLVTVKKS